MPKTEETEIGVEPPPRQPGTRRKYLTVRKVQKNRKQNSDQQPTDAQETGFQRRMGAFFPESGSGFGRRFGEAVRESTEREERLIRHKVWNAQHRGRISSKVERNLLNIIN